MTLRAGGPIGTDHLPHVFGIEARRERSRAYQIAEHDGEVASLGVVPANRLGDQPGLIEFGDHAQHFATMPEQDPKSIKVLVGQFGKDTEIDAIVGKTLRVLPKPKLLEPVRNLMHWLHRLSGRRLAEF